MKRQRNFATVAIISHEHQKIGSIMQRGNQFVFFIPPTQQRPYRRSLAKKSIEEAVEAARKYLTKKYDIEVSIEPAE